MDMRVSLSARVCTAAHRVNNFDRPIGPGKRTETRMWFCAIL